MMISCLCLFPFTALSGSFRKISTKQKIPEPFSQRIRFGYERYGGELGTRTPDPLRVMHDDFLIFRAMIR